LEAVESAAAIEFEIHDAEQRIAYLEQKRVEKIRVLKEGIEKRQLSQNDFGFDGRKWEKKELGKASAEQYHPLLHEVICKAGDEYMADLEVLREEWSTSSQYQKKEVSEGVPRERGESVYTKAEATLSNPALNIFVQKLHSSISR